jgi:putative hemolysin
MNIGLEITLVFLLVMANGIFAMAELAVVSARKTRLQQRAEEGSKGARVALELAEKPDDFLSTVQVGITLIGTLAGAFGGATLAEHLAAYLKQFALIAEYSETISITIVVLIISYLSLILGELVPKNIALSNAEGFAAALAPPMKLLARIGSPAVRFLTWSTRVVMKLIPLRSNTDAPVTQEEIRVLIAQGTEHGTFDEAEQEMVEGVFRLADRTIVELMQPRQKVAFLDLSENWEISRAVLRGKPYSRFPVVDGDLDRVVGVIHVKDLYLAMDAGQASIDLPSLARRPLIFPEQTPALDVMEQFQKHGEQMALVVDEHGGIQGLVTMADLMNSVVGVMCGGSSESTGRPAIIARDDDTWLADGSIPIHQLLEALKLRHVPGNQTGFATLGGLILAHLHRIPSPGDDVTVDGWHFEVMDMDANRIDKVLIRRSEKGE